VPGAHTGSGRPSRTTSGAGWPALASRTVAPDGVQVIRACATVANRPGRPPLARSIAWLRRSSTAAGPSPWSISARTVCRINAVRAAAAAPLPQTSATTTPHPSGSGTTS